MIFGKQVKPGLFIAADRSLRTPSHVRILCDPARATARLPSATREALPRPPPRLPAQITAIIVQSIEVNVIEHKAPLCSLVIPETAIVRAFAHVW